MHPSNTALAYANPFEDERIKAARLHPREQEREWDLLRLLPRGRRSVLDIGARDGHFSRLLLNSFRHVTAIDLITPTFSFPNVRTMQGDVRQLKFPDSSFDCVFCTEVLEHVSEVEQASAEIARVVKHEVIVGVPYRQDIRCGRTRCWQCGNSNPPWGHVNSFDEARLCQLFPSLHLSRTSYVGTRKEQTNWLSEWLMDLAGNPWGTYEQDELCVHCGTKLVAPKKRSVVQKLCGRVAIRLRTAQNLFAKPRPSWIHMVFTKAAKSLKEQPPAHSSDFLMPSSRFTPKLGVRFKE